MTAHGEAVITEIRCVSFMIPLRRAYRWRSGVELATRGVVVEVRTAAGISGYGEVILAQPEIAEELCRGLARFFLGCPVWHIEAPLAQICNEDRWRVTPRMTNKVVAAIEAACLDAAGRLLSVPASALLGGPVRAEVDAFGFVQGDDPDEIAADAVRLVTDGFTTLYMKIGRADPARDVEVVAGVRAAIGAEIPLRLDANEAWNMPTALDQLRRLEPYLPDWVEQPIAGDNIAGLAHLRRVSPVKIAADNAVYSRGELLRVLVSDAADTVVLAACEVGGLMRLRQCAYLADGFGVPLNRKGYLETDLSTFAALQVMACIPSLADGNQVMHDLLEHRLTRSPIDAEGGRIRVPDGPGLGFEIDADALAFAHERHARSAGTADSAAGQ